MDDKKIIELLEKIIDDKLLDDFLISQANMCIDTLNSSNDNNNKRNARASSNILLKKAGLIEIKKSPNRFDVEKRDNELLNNIPKLVEEIRRYLATKQLDSNLALCLEFVIEDLTNEQLSKEQKLEVIQKYYRAYEPAITSTDEYIAKSSNHGK